LFLCFFRFRGRDDLLGILSEFFRNSFILSECFRGTIFGYPIPPFHSSIPLRVHGQAQRQPLSPHLPPLLKTRALYCLPGGRGGRLSPHLAKCRGTLGRLGQEKLARLQQEAPRRAGRRRRTRLPPPPRRTAPPPPRRRCRCARWRARRARHLVRTWPWTRRARARATRASTSAPALTGPGARARALLTMLPHPSWPHPMLRNLKLHRSRGRQRTCRMSAVCRARGRTGCGRSLRGRKAWRPHAALLMDALLPLLVRKA